MMFFCFGGEIVNGGFTIQSGLDGGDGFTLDARVLNVA
jgi:hypothetical protein